ncbi:hypothetical protein TNCV_44551 [Trichonephila clavipes]|nr:hypothetical protein TNCV_44551 [Trichonephila clavipes]
MHQNLDEHGSFKTAIEQTGHPQTARTPLLNNCVLSAVNRNLGTIVRALVVSTERSRTTIHRILPGKPLHPFHVHRGQLRVLQPDDPP